METVTGFEPALMELQSIAFPLGYTVIVVYMLQIRYGLMRVKKLRIRKTEPRNCTDSLCVGSR